MVVVPLLFAARAKSLPLLAWTNSALSVVELARPGPLSLRSALMDRFLVEHSMPSLVCWSQTSHIVLLPFVPYDGHLLHPLWLMATPLAEGVHRTVVGVFSAEFCLPPNLAVPYCIR